ncbi:g7711 [Coccomyxa elongata]
MSTNADSAHAIAFVLIDGLGDVSVPFLKGKTPLQFASTKYLDSIAGAGLNGLLDPVEPGLACGSDTAHLSILGYEPRLHYRGRGAFESLGAGIAMEPGDIAFKCNFATLDTPSGIVISRRADRKFEDIGPRLCADLNGVRLPSFPQHTVSVKYATEHRCGVAVSGPGLSDAITGTDPLKDNLPLQEVRPLDDSREAAHTAAVVAELSAVLCDVLKEHPVNVERIAAGKPPANIVLLRGCGSRIAVETFEQRHGLRACMVAPTKIIAGLGMSLGVDCLSVPGATGDYRTQFHKKTEAIASALTDGGYRFGMLHVKAVDDTGHDRQAVLKVRYIEGVDAMVGQLIRRLWEAEAAGRGRFSLCITSDHSTPVEFGDHSHEPVPFAIARLTHVVEALGGDSAVRGIPLEPIPHPDPGESIADLLATKIENESVVTAAVETSAQHVVREFDEVAAAQGALGRFPGSQVMPLIRSFLSAVP